MFPFGDYCWVTESRATDTTLFKQEPPVTTVIQGHFVLEARNRNPSVFTFIDTMGQIQSEIKNSDMKIEWKLLADGRGLNTCIRGARIILKH